MQNANVEIRRPGPKLLKRYGSSDCYGLAVVLHHVTNLPLRCLRIYVPYETQDSKIAHHWENWHGLVQQSDEIFIDIRGPRSLQEICKTYGIKPEHKPTLVDGIAGQNEFAVDDEEIIECMRIVSDFSHHFGIYLDKKSLAIKMAEVADCLGLSIDMGGTAESRKANPIKPQ